MTSKLRPAGEVELGPVGKWQDKGRVHRGPGQTGEEGREGAGARLRRASLLRPRSRAFSWDHGVPAAVSRGEWCLRKVTLPAVRSEIGEGRGGTQGRHPPWRDGVKEGVDSLGGPKPEEGDSWGSWGGGFREAESPCPSLSPGEGPGCLPVISTASTAPGLSPAAPRNIPSERRREPRRLMDLSAQCRPALQAPCRVICFHQERCPSVSDSSPLRAARAGHPGRRSCLSSPNK